MSAVNHDPLRTGSFADGQTTVTTLVAPAARFCNGQEQHRDHADLREGCFADGQATLAVAPRVRGRFCTGQERVTAERAAVSWPGQPVAPIAAEGD